MNALVVMAKAPVAGLAKTRLAAAVGAEIAAQLAEAFLRDTLDEALRARGVETWLCYAPSTEEPRFRALGTPARLVPQVEGDLGARLIAITDSAFIEGAQRVVVIGTDSPQAGRERYERAFEALERADMTLGPSADGGYWLVGLRARAPGLFERVEWSTARVLEQTLERARDRELAVEQLDTLLDVDQPADLDRLRAELARIAIDRCAHTRRALAALR